MDTCALCQKHKGLGDLTHPLGGYIYEDEHFMVCHAPADKGPLGTLLIESKRHVLDFAEFNAAETLDYGNLTKKIYTALRPLVQAERIYQVSMMDGIPHFHAWILPRTADIKERGVAFIAKDLTCSEADAAKLAAKLREMLI